MEWWEGNNHLKSNTQSGWGVGGGGMGDHGGHQGDGGGGLENNHKKYLQILKVVVGTKQKGCNLCVDNKNANTPL